MSRLSTALAAAFAGGEVQMLALVRAEFDSGTIRLWTGTGALSWNSETWTGAGGVITNISLPSETAEIRTSGGSITLNGLDPSILALADTEPYQGRAITIYIGAKDSTGAVIVDPDMAYQGTMDVMEPTDEGETATVVLSIESRSASAERPSNRRLTPEDLALDYPGDKGFDFVAALQDKEIIWGPKP